MASEVVVVMVPFIAQGHLNQLLHLSRLISAYDLPVHFLCTAAHSRQARCRLHGWNPRHDPLIHFHDLPDPDFTSPPPDPNGITQFPTHLQASFDASLNLRHPVADLIRSLAQTSRRVAVIHDSTMSYVVQDVKWIPNAETYVFRPLSVFYHFCFTWEKRGRQLPLEPEISRRLPNSDGGTSQEFKEFARLQRSHQTFHVGYIYDSSTVIEGEFLECLQRDEAAGNSHWAVGPFNPVKIQPDSNNRHICLQWLDEQPADSVIYISFGTTTTFTEAQIEELAIGLEKSQQRFMWVLRDADKADAIRNEDHRLVGLPELEGFQDRVEGRGLIVRDWVPQLEILAHRSTGGFVSHCGWNSCMEAMTMGVAIAAWPIHSDQPRNAFLLAEVLGVALVMRDWDRKGELVSSAMVEKTVRRLMDTKDGDVVRKKASELGGNLRRSLAEGGVTRNELNSLVSFIRR